MPQLLRMPAFGLSGPWRDNVGFAQTMEQVTGMAWITGHRRPAPHPAGRATPTPGCRGVRARRRPVRARRHRPRLAARGHHGRAALNAAAELAIEATAYGNFLERDGSRSPGHAPQGLYRAQGDERWLAVSVATDEQWRGLVGALGAPDWASDRGCATCAARRARHDELDEHLAAWASTQDAGAAAEVLVAHGVPAAAARDPARCTRTRSIAPAPSTRTSTIPSWACGRRRRRRSGCVAAALAAHAGAHPGEHNHDILVGDLGVSEERYAALEAAGVIGTAPRASDCHHPRHLAL